MAICAPLRILLADDSAIVRRHLREVIEDVAGVDVVAEAADGAEAIDAVRALRPEIVLLDLQMPRTNGLQALRLVASDPWRPYVIVLTNHADGAYRDACFAAGADRFFDKSADLDGVLDALRQRVREAVLSNKRRAEAGRTRDLDPSPSLPRGDSVPPERQG